MAGHHHAVVRDLVTLGFDIEDVGGRLSLATFLSIVLASPPGSSVRFFAVDEQWTPTDHLIANLGEQQAGLLNLGGRYPRPGVRQVEQELPVGPVSPSGALQMAPMSIDEFKARRERDRLRAEDLAKSEKKVVM